MRRQISIVLLCGVLVGCGGGGGGGGGGAPAPTAPPTQTLPSATVSQGTTLLSAIQQALPGVTISSNGPGTFIQEIDGDITTNTNVNVLYVDAVGTEQYLLPGTVIQGRDAQGNLTGSSGTFSGNVSWTGLPVGEIVLVIRRHDTDFTDNVPGQIVRADVTGLGQVDLRFKLTTQ